MAEVLLDTHALVWWLGDGPKLSQAAIGAIEEAHAVRISAISFWEIGMLVGKGRISLDRPTRAWVSDVLAVPRVKSVSLDPDVAVAAAELEDFNGDPADRILVATAIAGSTPLVTKDRGIQAWARSNPLDCIW